MQGHISGGKVLFVARRLNVNIDSLEKLATFGLIVGSLGMALSLSDHKI